MRFLSHHCNFPLALYAIVLSLGYVNKAQALVPSSSVQKPHRSVLGENDDVVIVGGGPIGLAAALQLSSCIGEGRKITVLERAEKASDLSRYNPSRSFLFNINPRGFCWIDQQETNFGTLSLTDRILAKGVVQEGVFGKFCAVPADPEQPVPDPKSLTVGGTSPKDVEALKKAGFSLRSVWIPRHELVGLLQDACRENKNIEVRCGRAFKNLETSPSTSQMQVTCTNGETYRAALVVAADGVNSDVRKQLQDYSKLRLDTHVAGSFRPRRYASPATGLQLKAMQFPAQFPIGNRTATESSDGTANNDVISVSDCIYSLRGVNKGRSTFLSLGLLPIADNNSPRPANTIGPFDHELWKLNTPKECKQWFQANWPRLDWDTLVDDAEWERYCNAPFTTFPSCQYTPGSVAHSDNNHGVVLLGDACHSFPPDIGQGINAGFQDVVALERSLTQRDIETGEPLPSEDAASSSAKPASLGEVLDRYQSNRSREHKALIQLSRFGSPYQYSQPWRRHRFGRKLWTANIVLRLLLHKASFKLLPPAAILLTQNPRLSYAQVMRKANRLTCGLWGGIVCVAVWILFKLGMIV